jgi:hypothetical protein
MVAGMRVGLALPVAPELNEPGVIGALVRAAEGLGFSSLWVSDHLLLPPGDFIPHGHQPDPLAMLGWLAAETERVGIGTSVLVLPKARGSPATRCAPNWRRMARPARPRSSSRSRSMAGPPRCCSAGRASPARAGLV